MPISHPRMGWSLLLTVLFAGSADAQPQPSVVARWNAAALAEVRFFKSGPPAVARALAIAHTCMYDAWAPYDARAIALVDTSPRRPSSEAVAANKAQAISFAAYRCLSNLFPTGLTRLNAVMAGLGYNPADSSTDLATPQGIGNAAAAAVIASRRYDGANQYGDLAAGAYADYSGFVPANAPMPFCLPTTPGACALNITDPYHWQPLTNNLGATQRFVTPFWERVKPFALASAAQFDSLAAVANGPNYLLSAALLQSDIDQMLSLSGSIDEQRKLIVEYWADGPDSELPPGHWGLFAQAVSLRDGNSIDQDVKMFFAMHNASFDAGIVAWHLKRKYQGVRPITVVRHFGQGHTVLAWGGPGQPVQAIDAGKWTPYNPGSNLTPAFPGYIAGHSTFSAASAAVLRAFTGSDAFGFSTLIPANFGRVEPGVPAVPTTLSYPSFSAAAAEAGLSRLYAGIHFADDNSVGQDLGNRVGAQAWGKSQFLFDGGLSTSSTSVASSPKARTLSWQHTVPPLSNRLLIVGTAAGNDGADAVRSVNYGGAPLTRLGWQDFARKGKPRAELWYLVGPALGTATVVVEMDQAKDIVAGASTYVGVNPQMPFGTLVGDTGKGNLACLTLANEPAPLVASMVSVNGKAQGIQPGLDQIQQWLGVSNQSGDYFDDVDNDDILGKGASFTSTSIGTVCNLLEAKAPWAMLAVPLRPAF